MSGSTMSQLSNITLYLQSAVAVASSAKEKKRVLAMAAAEERRKRSKLVQVLMR